MKIAIQGHITRGKDVIKILESIGGINKLFYNGRNQYAYYYIDENNFIDKEPVNEISTQQYKFYTLTEFEKEFPFKIGDEVICLDYYNKKGTIVSIEPCGPVFSYFIKLETGNGIYRPAKHLKPYKEMKEERNITLTLDKAKEWYQKGGELREIALQAFTKEELNPLPKSWNEFCKMYPTIQIKYIFASDCPQKYIALWKLEQLRDCYRQGWKPDWKNCYTEKYCIVLNSDKLVVSPYGIASRFLAFQSKEVAEDFLKNFDYLIKEAGDLI